MNSVPIEDRLAELARQLIEPGTSKQPSSNLLRQVVKLIVEQMLEAELAEQLGRPRYERQASDAPSPSAPPEYRNGHKPRQLRTAEGKGPIDLPQARNVEGWSSKIWPALRSRSEVLDVLATEMYARGLSTRDIEDLLGEIDDGDGRPVLGRSSVSRISARPRVRKLRATSRLALAA